MHVQQGLRISDQEFIANHLLESLVHVSGFTLLLWVSVKFSSPIMNNQNRLSLRSIIFSARTKVGVEVGTDQKGCLVKNSYVGVQIIRTAIL